VRARLVPVFIVGVLALQAGLAINGHGDAHKFFAFQPFHESSIWKAEIVRVTSSGQRLSVEDGWAGYRWDELVHIGALRSPFRFRHASRGVDATLEFLDHALDWIARHTPADRETRYLEARVTYYRNTRGPETVVLRSVERSR